MIKQDNIIHPLTSFMSFTPIFTISGQHSFFSENWSFHLVSFAFSPKNFLSMFYNASVLATSSFSFLLPDNVSFHFHSWMIFSLATAFWVANWLFCFVFHFKDVSLFETLQFLIRSDTLIGLLSSCMYYAIVLLVFTTGFQHFWQPCAGRDAGFCVYCAWCSHLLSVFFPFVFFIVSISRLRRLISVLRFLCIENMFHAMKTLRKVKAMALRFLSVSFNIWFILGLNSIDFLLCRERVPFSWCLGCREILDCILNNIKLWRFLSGIELQTLYFV